MQLALRSLVKFFIHLLFLQLTLALILPPILPLGAIDMDLLGSKLPSDKTNSTSDDRHNELSRSATGLSLNSAEATRMLVVLQDIVKREDLIRALKKIANSKENKGLDKKSLTSKIAWKFLWDSFNRENLLIVLETIFRISIIIALYVLMRRGLNEFLVYYGQKIPLIHQEQYGQSATVALVKTISPIIRSIIHWVLGSLAILLILSELSVNIMPILYSFSVIGLAVSIGSQTLVKDLINGIMTLFEGNMAVGDVVTIGHFRGTVESISLRCVHLRHGNGELQTIPFSEVNHVINHSRDYTIAGFGFTVDFKADLKQVEEALIAVFDRVKANKAYARMIRSELKKLSITRLEDSGIRVHTSVKTLPDPSGSFSSEFYRLLIPEIQSRNIPIRFIPTTSSDKENPKLDGD